MTEEKEKIIARLYCKLRHELRVYAARYCPDEAEDIVHQAFVNGYDKIVEERNESEQRSYLYSTVKNVNIEDMNFWEKPGDDADYPEFGQSFEVRTDSNVEKVHSVSLKQLTLGYDMSKKLSKKIGFSGVRLFFTAENLFYLSNYSGDNPEVVDIYTGVDNGSNYPLPRKYSVGLTLNF